ncbi:unnamed protein product [Brassica oleracea]
MGYGTITAHSLMGLEARGTLFVSPGLESYDGMIIGEHSRDTDLDVSWFILLALKNDNTMGSLALQTTG